MPQPIDPSSELGRVAAAERVQNMMDRAAQFAQLRQLDDAADDTIRQQEQTQEAEQKEDEVDDEQRRRNPYVFRRRRRSDEERKEEERAAGYDARLNKNVGDDPDDHAIDIKL